jgi:hypothetical protein
LHNVFFASFDLARTMKINASSFAAALVLFAIPAAVA